MRIVVKKYGRWDETCNWQLEGRAEKDMSEDDFNTFAEYAGFTPGKYGWHSVSEDRLRMTVVEQVKAKEA